MKEKYAIIRMYFIHLTNKVFDREITEMLHKNLNKWREKLIVQKIGSIDMNVLTS